MRLFLFRFFRMHNATQTETVTQISIIPTLLPATVIINIVFDKPNRNCEDDDTGPMNVYAV